ncbi:MAG: tRNA uridine-5-carboxymethylaminomethyl(34) synthesis GTPase MnmE [Citromicrobium sp.]|nr:MAG: tRNA uridine-5-carboxymethylaminomethyl(34) synthesis GTPase MnmE [Citromicrobium sp.]
MSATIFALSSGAPPAAIGIIRISGPHAGDALSTLVGKVASARKATLRTLRARDGSILDTALVIWFPGPRTATGENLAEIHCHGGRAVVRAIENALAELSNLRRAEPGEFTRRAFANGVIDLAEAEGLADLLSSETELQRLAAQASAGGGFSRQVEEWRGELLKISAEVEAALDFADEGDVEEHNNGFPSRMAELADVWRVVLDQPRAERLRNGVRVILAGPPNSGKSSLFNALLGEGAAIVTPIAGTTRDVIERSISINGVPLVLVDTAGLRETGQDEVEAIGIDRARQALTEADIVLWLGAVGEGPEGAWEISARCDLPDERKRRYDFMVSSVTGEGLSELAEALTSSARDILPKPGTIALNQRQAGLLSEAQDQISGASRASDLLVLAERLRLARVALDRLLGRDSTEEMLDLLFGRFCIGK